MLYYVGITPDIYSDINDINIDSVNSMVHKSTENIDKIKLFYIG